LITKVQIESKLNQIKMYTREVIEIAEDLKEKVKLTNYQALTLAVELHRTRIFARAFVVGSEELDYPTALEKISMNMLMMDRD
jgi:hypothetical protein